MDTFVGFTKNDLVKNVDSFYDEYALVYPDATWDAISGIGTERYLYRKLVSILIDCEILVDGYKENIRIGYENTVSKMRKLSWLLCNMTLTGLSSQLQSFIIKTNNPNLSDMDYVLLFYISLQSQEVQNATRDLPLSMLHDMFFPVAEDNLREWKLNS
jgi:hypothetical protein